MHTTIAICTTTAVLSDREQKRNYDMFGTDASSGDPFGGRAGHPFGGAGAYALYCRDVMEGLQVPRVSADAYIRSF